MRIGYASGAFDMFHIGHLNLLRQAKLQCDQLIAGVITDRLYQEVRGRPPIVPFTERLQIVRNIEFVDFAIGDDHMDKMFAWEQLRFDVLIKGDDWKYKPEAAALKGKIEEAGIEIAYVPYTEHTSSTRLRTIVAELERGAAADSVTD